MSVTTKKDYIAFTGGLDTETNNIIEQEGTCSDISNFKINKDGSFEMRNGILPLNNLFKELDSNGIPYFYTWENVNGNIQDSFYVVKKGKYIHFYNTNKAIAIENILPLSINLTEYLTTGYTIDQPEDFSVSFSDGDGYLFVVGKYIEPLLIEYNKIESKMNVVISNVMIRDYFGLDDGIKDETEHPKDFNDRIVYNLINQGFEENDISQYFADNGYLPSKTEIQSRFKYTKISSDYKNPSNPEEVYNYKINQEHNFGTGKAPVGKKIIEVFKQNRKISGSKVTFSPTEENLLSICGDDQSNTVTLTIKANREPRIPANEYIELKPILRDFFPTFPIKSIEYSDKNFGEPIKKEYTPLIADWGSGSFVNNGYGIYESREDAPFNVNSTTTEAEYKSFGFLNNNTIHVKNVVEKNIYVMICYTYADVDWFKQKLVTETGGTIVEEFVLPSAWNLPENQKGKYIRIETNAKTDNNYNNRKLLKVPFQTTFWYEKWVTLPDGSVEQQTVSAPTESISCQLQGSTLHSGKVMGRFLSDTVFEIVVSNAFKYTGDLDRTLPEGFATYRFNSKDKGRTMYGIKDIVSSGAFEFTVSNSDIDIDSQEEPYRPESVAFYANRLFYSAFNSDVFSNHVFFTQMLDIKNNLSKCYSLNDPTSPINNNSLPTDGGYLTLPEADKILNLVVVKEKLVVICRNSVYAIFGNPFFKADSYGVVKIADIGMTSANAFTVVGDTIVIASDNGLYNFNINQQNGDLTANNFSNQKIKSIYTGLTREQKQHIKLKYNEYEKKLFILFNNNKALAPSVYTSMIIYDFDIKSFYKYDIEQYGDLQLLDFFNEIIYNKDKPNSLVIYNSLTSEYNIAAETKDKYKDLSESNTPFTCSLESNYINFNDVIRNKQVSRLIVYADNTVSDQECKAYIKYDSYLNSSKWSKPEQIYRLQNKCRSNVLIHEQMCRGEGLFFKIRFEGSAEKYCKILGFTIKVNGNQQI